MVENKNDIPLVISVKALQDYKIFVAFNEGTKGVIDLSNKKGKGVFKAWDEGGLFSKVYVSSRNSIAWNDELEIDSLNCYLQLTTKSFEEYAGS